MSKITNDDLTQSGTGCFIAVRMTIVEVSHYCMDNWTISQQTNSITL